MNEGTFYNIIAGYALLLGILLFIDKTKWGHPIVYYSLVLLIVGLLLANSPQIASIINGVQKS